MRNWLFILFFAYFFISGLHAQAQEDEVENVIEEEQTEEWDYSDVGDSGEYESWEDFDIVEPPRPPTKAELERRERETERLARKIVTERFKKIDEQRKIEDKEDKIRKKLEKKRKRGKYVPDPEEEERAKKEQELKEKEERERAEKERAEKERKKQERDILDFDWDEAERVSYDEGDLEEYEEEGFYEDYGIDSVLLAKKIAILEMEMWNERHIADAKKGKGGSKLLKLKIPNCYYLNSVIYERGEFEFIYQLDFFVHYFEHRFHHKRRFYDLEDPIRVVAKQVMNFAGNTRYRKTNFNIIVDSIGALSGKSVAEELDKIITELNLEYIATGDIKINYKNKNQRRMYATVTPSNIDRRSLGNISFYTWDKKRIIEQIDASPYNAYLPFPEKDYMDSIMKVSIILPSGDSLRITPIFRDSLSPFSVKPIFRDSLSPATPIFRDSLSPVSSDRKTESNTIPVENTPEQKNTPIPDTEKVKEKDATLPPTEEDEKKE